MSALKSASSSVGGALINMLMALIGMYIFGRLLTPEEFGVFALAYSIYMIFNPLIDFGLTAAYIQLDEVNEEVNSCFYLFNVLCGVVVAIAITISAPILAYIYEEPQLIGLTLPMALMAILMSFANQPISQLMRAKRFFTRTVIDSSSTLLGLILAVAMAFTGWGAWSLIMRSASFSFFRLVLANLYVRPKYKLLNKSTLKKYIPELKFGGTLAVSRLIAGYSNNLDRFVVGKVFGQTTLGHYDRGQQIAEKPSILRNALTGPAIAHIARLPKKAHGRAYVIVSLLVFLAAGLPCLILFLYGDVLTILILSDTFTEAGSYTKFLAFLGFGIVLRGLTNIIHINENKVKRLLKFYVFHILLVYPIAVGMLIIYKVDILAFVALFSFLNFMYWLCIYMYTIWAANVEVKMLSQTLSYIFIMIITFCGGGYWLKEWIQITPLVELVLVPVIAGLGTLLVIRLLFPTLFMLQETFVRSQIGQYRNRR